MLINKILIEFAGLQLDANYHRRLLVSSSIIGMRIGAVSRSANRCISSVGASRPLGFKANFLTKSVEIGQIDIGLLGVQWAQFTHWTRMANGVDQVVQSSRNQLRSISRVNLVLVWWKQIENKSKAEVRFRSHGALPSITVFSSSIRALRSSLQLVSGPSLGRRSSLSYTIRTF